MESNYSIYSDEEMARLAQNGDQDAEETLIRKYSDVVKGKAHLYFIMGADAEDVVQEGMIGIFKAIKSYNEDKQASFNTFANLCINRQIITAVKRANRMKHAPLNTSISLSKPVSDSDTTQTMAELLYSGDETDPEAMLILKEMVDFISSNEDKLFSKMECEVWHKYSEGKGYQKIAEELGKSPKSVDNAIQRIKKKISPYFGS